MSNAPDDDALVAEPRGCPTPGACSAVARITELRTALAAMTAERDALRDHINRIHAANKPLGDRLASAGNGYVVAEEGAFLNLIRAIGDAPEEPDAEDAP